MNKLNNFIEANTIIKPALIILQKSNNKAPNLDCRILLGHAMGLNRSVYPHEQIKITQKEINKFKTLIDERKKGKPVSRIINKKQFWKMNFTLNEETLDPRPDSEVIIESILKHFKDKLGNLRILDLGSGSGCLGLSILNEYKNSKGILIDASLDSLEIAKINAVDYNLFHRSKFINLNWFKKEWTKELLQNIENKKFDIIISNPPYIPSNDINNLQIEVKKFEPRLALDGGKDGMDSYKSILPNIIDILKPEGKIFLEIGHNQQNLINKIANKCELIFKDSNKDLSGIIRVLVYGLK
jgi:release factor glutamine methyltransferase|tara:strand:+ start:131 stop:1024 length:894 start_codon:yes stop_codon:yes gene_type:complete